MPSSRHGKWRYWGVCGLFISSLMTTGFTLAEVNLQKQRLLCSLNIFLMIRSINPMEADHWHAHDSAAKAQRFCPEEKVVQMNRLPKISPEEPTLLEIACERSYQWVLQVYSTAWLTIVTMLYIRTPELIHLLTEGFYSLTMPHSW